MLKLDGPLTDKPPMPDGGAGIRDYLRDQRRRNLSDGTVDKRAYTLRRVQAHAGVALIDVNREQIERWLDTCKISPRTRYAYISHIAAFFAWAIREGRVDVDPTARIVRPKVRTGLPRPIATADLRHALEQAVDTEVSAMLHLAAFLGMRCIEISRLDAADVLDSHDPPMLIAHGKGGKQRPLPLHPDALDALRRHGLPIYGPVFDHPAWRVSHIIRGHLQACGIRASAHQLRHWFATATYEESGHDLRMVQELLGHSSPTTTAIYTRWSQARAMDVVARLSA